MNPSYSDLKEISDRKGAELSDETHQLHYRFIETADYPRGPLPNINLMLSCRAKIKLLDETTITTNWAQQVKTLSAELSFKP
jgi:hypothetical protein